VQLAAVGRRDLDKHMLVEGKILAHAGGRLEGTLEAADTNTEAGEPRLAPHMQPGLRSIRTLDLWLRTGPSRRPPAPATLPEAIACLDATEVRLRGHPR